MMAIAAAMKTVEVGAADDADEHREREPLEHFPTEQIQREHA
jgi:hypothetical protein